MECSIKTGYRNTRWTSKIKRRIKESKMFSFVLSISLICTILIIADVILIFDFVRIMQNML